MQLQYPKIAPSLSVARYEDYRKVHQQFMRRYKELYEEVAGFTLLPEKFINEAEPIIQQFTDKLNSADANAFDKLRLQIVTDFIERFYAFMDKAAEMFTEHQILAEQTLNYLAEVSAIKHLHATKPLEEFESKFIDLLPRLENLNKEVALVKQKIDFSNKELNTLRPIWKQILEKMPA